MPHILVGAVEDEDEGRGTEKGRRICLVFGWAMDILMILVRGMSRQKQGSHAGKPELRP